jgi:class 3 adenylate cyclase
MAMSSAAPGPPWQTYLLIFLPLSAAVLSLPLLLIGLARLPERARAVRPARGPSWPWLLPVPFALMAFSDAFGYPLARTVPWSIIVWMLSCLTALLVATFAYRRADARGRRQLRWVLYGGYMVWVPILSLAALYLLFGLAVPGWTAWLPLTWLAFPICILIAISRDSLLDIDRLFSATIAYSLLLIACLAIALAGLPSVAAAASTAVGVDSRVGQVALSILVAALAVSAQSRLRPLIDRVFFAERYAVERGIADLLHKLPACTTPRQLFETCDRRLDAVLQPRACRTYVRGPDGFTLAGAGADGEPIDLHGPLVAVLRNRVAPLTAQRGSLGRHSEAMNPFERAALETLDAAVALPIRHRDELQAIVCLGEKRSGDDYSGTELTLLAAVTDRVASELGRIEQSETLRREREAKDALRRYVPEQLATKLARGEELESAEREVSVMMVDIRGSTPFAEGRALDELFAVINRFTEATSSAVHAHGGTVTEFSGDGVMAVFGALEASSAKETQAVRAAREIIGLLHSMPAGAAQGGIAGLTVGIGIATGLAFVGTIRSADRLIWSVIGTTANRAARLQSLTRDLAVWIAIDAGTRRAADQVATGFVKREGISLRGFSEPEDVYVL